MSGKKKLIPTHFTSREGGYWNIYEGPALTRKQLKQAVKDGFKCIVIKAGPLAHSLAFNRVVTEVEDVYSEYQRWDALNGWTTELPV